MSTLDRAPRVPRRLAAAALVLACAGAARAQVASGALATEIGGHTVILDSRVAQLIRTRLPVCNPKLLIFTQCYGGNFVNKFQSDGTIAVASATGEGEKSNYSTYDFGAAIGLDPAPGRNAQLMHNDAIQYAQQAAANAGITLLGSPTTGGGLSLANFALQATTVGAQQFVHILFYAAQPQQPDLDTYMLIREHYPWADLVVVSSGLMQPWTNYDAHEYGLDLALEAIGQRMTSCGHVFILFVGDHGHQIWDAGTEQEIFQNIQIPTPALPPSVGEDLLNTPNPSPGIVLFLPYPPNTPNFTTPPAGPPPFEPSNWFVSVPLTTGSYESAAARQSYRDGGNGTVGDGPDEGIQLEFDMTAAQFIDAFVGHTNVVTVTNGTGSPKRIRLTLDPGPTPMVPLPDPCPFFTAHPQNATACHAGGATFAVTAEGEEPLAYAWEIEVSPGVWEVLATAPLALPCGGSATATPPDAAATLIAIQPCPGVLSYQVRCIVTNACGGDESDPATYSVCYPNCDCSTSSPALNVADFSCFLSAFAAGGPYANCDHSTAPPVLNVSDFSCFLSSYAAGCP